jgi:hypothetical protein
VQAQPLTGQLSSICGICGKFSFLPHNLCVSRQFLLVLRVPHYPPNNLYSGGGIVRLQGLYFPMGSTRSASLGVAQIPGSEIPVYALCYRYIHSVIGIELYGVYYR